MNDDSKVDTQNNSGNPNWDNDELMEPKQKEVEVTIKEGVAKLSFSIPQEMDMMTAKGVVQQISQFIKVLDKTMPVAQQTSFPSSTPYRKLSVYFNLDERKNFLIYYDKNGLKSTMNKYDMDNKQVYSRVYAYRKNNVLEQTDSEISDSEQNDGRIM